MEAQVERQSTQLRLIDIEKKANANLSKVQIEVLNRLIEQNRDRAAEIAAINFTDTEARKELAKTNAKLREVIAKVNQMNQRSPAAPSTGTSRSRSPPLRPHTSTMEPHILSK